METTVRNVWRFYTLVLAIGISIIWLLLYLAPDNGLGPLPRTMEPSFINMIEARLREPLVILFFQILSILSLAKIAGKIASMLGQPSVFGEILAGIILGPSVFGLLATDAQQWLFPVDSLDSLELLSQLGIVIFLFGIGAELDLALLRHRSKQMLLVSHSSVILPFALGIGSAYWLYADYAASGVSFTNFALFMGIAMSITAFPVLVRILRERGMTGTPLGNLATACAAIDDVTAWCLLAGVVAISQSADSSSALIVVGLTIVWSVFLLFVIRGRLQYLTVAPEHTQSLIVALLLFCLLSAAITELIGIHALFGAFIAGAAVAGHPQLRHIVSSRIEPLALALLLPLFFAYTGLRTQIGLLDGYDWIVCLGVVLVATAGKFGGASLAARISGSSWHDAFTLGLLMNTRGLMELVVLNIGYDLGILSDRVFAIMVMMTLITTFATGPLLKFFYRPTTT